MAMYDKHWGYILRSEPQTLEQCLKFDLYRSTNTIQQAGGKIEREKLEYTNNIGMW